MRRRRVFETSRPHRLARGTIADGKCLTANFRVVGHAGPQALTPGGTAGTTFPANVRVRQGDLLGLDTPTLTPCGFKEPGGRLATFSADLADGAAAEFGVENDFDLDVQAVFVPDNTISLGGITRNKRKGTATFRVSVPNSGELAVSGNGLRATGVTGAVAAISVSAAGEVKLLIQAKGKKRRKLNKTGQVEVTPRITYTPTGGDPSTQSRKLKLRKL